MKKYSLALLLLLFSCSHTIYTGKGRIPIEIHSDKVSDKIFLTHEVEKHSLLWGIVPDRVHYEMGDLMYKNRVVAIGNLTITEYQSFSDQVWTLLSLGLYVPSHVKIEGWGSRIKNDFK